MSDKQTNTQAYYRGRDGQISYMSRRGWNDLPLDVLTEAVSRLNLDRLLELGYILQRNINGTITFWHPQTPPDAGSPQQRVARIQTLFAAGALLSEEDAKQPLDAGVIT
jgi:hypothetical protein